MALNLSALATWITTAGLAGSLGFSAVPVEPVNPVEPIAPSDITAPTDDPRPQRVTHVQMDERQQALRTRLAEQLRSDEPSRAEMIDLVSAMNLPNKITPERLVAELWHAHADLDDNERERFAAFVQRSGPHAALRAYMKWKDHERAEKRKKRRERAEKAQRLDKRADAKEKRARGLNKSAEKDRRKADRLRGKKARVDRAEAEHGHDNKPDRRKGKRVSPQRRPVR